MTQRGATATYGSRRADVIAPEPVRGKPPAKYFDLERNWDYTMQAIIEIPAGLPHPIRVAAVKAAKAVLACKYEVGEVLAAAVTVEIAPRDADG